MTFSTKRLLRSICTKKARRDRGSKKKGVTGSWDLNIPSELLQEILSRLGLKDNIQASSVCKTWLEAAVSVRPRPLVFYPQRVSDGDYILLDPSRCATYNLNFPDLKATRFRCSRDGWLLVSRKSSSDLIFFLDPFTRERIYLPMGPCCYEDYFVAFSAAPTSTSCLVILLSSRRLESPFDDDLPLRSITYSVINTWRPGETVWTTHHFDHPLPFDGWEHYLWVQCLFSNGIFYCLSTSCRLWAFDPSRKTWNTLLVERVQALFLRPVLMIDHEGDIFLITTRYNDHSSVFKLNLERKVWEEKREVGGLSVFVRYMCGRSGL